MSSKVFVPLAWITLGALLSTGTAVAATGSPLVLGRANSAAGTTTVSTSSGAPLTLIGPATTPPLAVSSAVRVGHLNSDLLDGVDSAAFQRRISGACPDGAVRSIAASGVVACTAVARQWMAVVGPDGSLERGSDGVGSGRYLHATGTSYVQLPADVSACAWTATPATGATSAAVGEIGGHPDYVSVTTFAADGPVDAGFHLVVTCG
jgi:hypothetical protein